MRTTLASAFLAAFCLFGPAKPAAAHDIYYTIIFGSEDDPKHLKYSHTFAVFIRASGEGPDPSTYCVTWHTISWMPRTLVVKVNDPRPEPGVNLTLDDTIRFVMGQGQSVTAWGPYRIGPEVYNRSVEVYNKLNSGQELYRAIDGPINNRVSDCIHAVGDVDPEFGRRRYALDKVGKPASAYIAQQIVRRTRFDQSQLDNRWLNARLGLTQYPIEYVNSQGSARVVEFEIRSFKSQLRKFAHGHH